MLLKYDLSIVIISANLLVSGFFHSLYVEYFHDKKYYLQYSKILLIMFQMWKRVLRIVLIINTFSHNDNKNFGFY